MIKILTATFGLSVIFALSLSKNKQQYYVATKFEDQVIIRQFDSVIVLESKSETSANVSFGDVDGDDDLDIVLAKGRHWPLFNKIFFNNGKTASPNVINLGTKPDNTYSTVLSDVYGDVALDIVVSNDKDDMLVYFNNCKGVFSVSQTWGDAKWNTRNTSVADLNNVGKLDIIAANRKQPSYYCINDGFGKFSPQNTKAIPSESATTIVPADFNIDGFVDLAIPHRYGGQSFIFYDDVKANFITTQPFGPAISNARTAAAADLNNDGWADLVVGYAVSKITALFNSGNTAKFTAIKFGDGKGTVYGMALGDIDKDGFWILV